LIDSKDFALVGEIEGIKTIEEWQLKGNLYL